MKNVIEITDNQILLLTDDELSELIKQCEDFDGIQGFIEKGKLIEHKHVHELIRIGIVMHNYNMWRRGVEGIDQPDPKTIGETIDKLIEIIKSI